MKQYIIIISILALAFTSCNDFLDIAPDVVPSESTYFQSDKDAVDALNPIYDVLRQEGTFGRVFFFEQSGCGDDLIWGRPRNEVPYIVEFGFTGRESWINESTSHMTTCLARSNWIINNLLKKSALSPVEKRSLGEAYFFRGFAHFWYAYRYGLPTQGVPFDRYEDYNPYEYGIPVQRASVMENYDLIIQDMEKAAELLPYVEEYGKEDIGRAHKAACWGYMVKTYAYWAQWEPEKWALIPPLADKIETEGKRGLLDNFADVFKMANNFSKEYIFSISSHGTNRAGSKFPGVVLENTGWGAYNGWGYFKPTLGLYNEFAEGDQRRRVTMLEYNDEFKYFGTTRRYYSTMNIESGFMLAKYLEPFEYGEMVGSTGVSPYVSADGNNMTTDLAVPLIRFAEIVLFKAEALIMQGNGTAGATELNRISKRAGLGNLYTNATMDDLKHERRCELAGEHTDRFMDLKRWKEWNKLNEPRMVRVYEDRANPLSPWKPGIAEQAGARTFNPSKNIVFPYNPDDVIKADGKLKQNPGY